MNVFRLAGDLSHLFAIIILLLKIFKSRSCAGISGRSQILFVLVYTTRYLDLFTHFVSIYNSVMKVIFIGTSLSTLYLIYVKFKTTYDHKYDTFRIDFLINPAIILSILLNHELSLLEVLWTFSIYLESVAILPQLFMMFKTDKAENITFLYLFCLGSYRALYILNWIYRYYSENFYDLIAVVAGIVQTVIYFEFFCLYVSKSGNKCLDWPKDNEIILSGSMDMNHVWDAKTGHLMNHILSLASKNKAITAWCIVIPSNLSGDSCEKTSLWNGDLGILQSSTDPPYSKVLSKEILHNIPQADNIVFTSIPSKVILYSGKKIYIISCEARCVKPDAVYEKDSDSEENAYLFEINSDNSGNVIISCLKNLKSGQKMLKASEEINYNDSTFKTDVSSIPSFGKDVVIQMPNLH